MTLPFGRQLAVALLVVGACSSAPEPTPAPPPTALAPWSMAPLPANRVPRVYLDQWQLAANRLSCAPVAPGQVDPEDAVPRAATFGGGWGVAYDLPELRSAFGVAGTGVEARSSTYDDWPFRRAWSDGSSVGYGPEGGSGPNQLAYLRISGQDCLYNVWSRIDVQHLERLLDQLRFVSVDGG